MTAEQQSKLHAMLTRLGAGDLAMEVAAVLDVRDLEPDVRGQILDVIGAEAASRGPRSGASWTTWCTRWGLED